MPFGSFITSVHLGINRDGRLVFPSGETISTLRTELPITKKGGRINDPPHPGIRPDDLYELERDVLRPYEDQERLAKHQAAWDKRTKDEIRGKLDLPYSKRAARREPKLTRGQLMAQEENHCHGITTKGERCRNDASCPVNHSTYLFEKEGKKPVNKNLFIISFTGHRPNKLGGYTRNHPKRVYTKRQMLEHTELLVSDAVERDLEPVVVWGGALGTDQWAAQLANHLGLRHCCILPFDKYIMSNPWPPQSQTVFNDLCDTTDEDLAKLIYKAIREKFNPVAREGGTIILRHSWQNAYYQLRNMAMVDVGDILVCVYNGTTGGTHNCVEYAKQISCPMDTINPDDYNKES